MKKQLPNLETIYPPLNIENIVNRNDEIFPLAIYSQRLRRSEFLTPSEFNYFCALCCRNESNLPPDISNIYSSECLHDGKLRDEARFIFYKTRISNNESLTDAEEKDLSNLYNHWGEQINVMIIDAIRRSGEDTFARALYEHKDKIVNLIRVCLDFRSEVLLSRTKTIWWDRKSMLHIFSAHVEEVFLSYYNKPNKKPKTLFLHSLNEIRDLIIRVLEKVDQDIQDYFVRKPSGMYRRTTLRLIEFDGDNYALRIDNSGKLTMFHRTEPPM